MTRRLYLHIGPHKTGTTYIQGLLRVNHDLLKRQGLLSPLPTLGAVKDVMRPGTKHTGVFSQWGRLHRTLQSWRGPAAIISHEVISSASDKELTRLVNALRGFDVHVIYTIRDLSRVAPAMWQTGLRGTNSYTWEEYARSLQRPESDDVSWGEKFWRNQDAPAVLRRWSAHVPRENLHLVTVPRPGSPPELLWQRFCTVLGIETAEHNLQPPRSNPSLGTAESELMRRVNEAMAETSLGYGRRLTRMRWLGRELETRCGMARFTLPAEDFDWITRRAEAVIAGLRAGGYDIVGDLDELVPQPVDEQVARHPSDTTPEAVLEVAVDAVRRLILELADKSAPSARQRVRPRVGDLLGFARGLPRRGRTVGRNVMSGRDSQQ